jgi:hypothetical protein
MAFSFGFSGDDIDIDDSEISNGVPDVLPPRGTTNSLPELVKPSKHDINEWVSQCTYFLQSFVLRIKLCIMKLPPL